MEACSECVPDNSSPRVGLAVQLAIQCKADYVLQGDKMIGGIKRYPVHLNMLKKFLKLDLTINTFRLGQMM